MATKNISQKVLIVEDDKTSATMLNKLLNSLGYFVVDIIETGEESIKRAEEIRPDLVLMDITLSGEIDGIDAASEIYEKYNIPVVFLTASTDDETIERAKKVMPYGYVLKPYDRNLLRVTIEIALYKVETEKKLLSSVQHNRDILSSIPDVMFNLDHDGNFVYDFEATIAKRIWPKKVSEFASPQIKKVANGSDHELFEYTLKKGPDVKYYEARIFKSSDSNLLVIVRDITEKKKAQVELENYKKNLEELVDKRTRELSVANQDLETEVSLRLKMGMDIKMFSMAIDQSPSVVVFIKKDGVIEYVNAKFTEVSGYTAQEILGSNVNENNHVIPEPDIWNKIISVKKWDGEIYNLNKNKELYYLNAYVTSIMGDDKKISNYILVADDITNKKKEKIVLDDVKNALESKRTDKFDKEMDWKEWKEKMLSRNISRTDKSLFRNINNSFTQGAGFGTLISLLEMLNSASKVEGEKRLVDNKIFQLIMENVNITQDAFKTFSNIDWIISNEFDLKKISFDECFEIVRAAIDDLEDLQKIHGHKILLSESKEGYKNVFINVNKEYFFKAMQELIINALKFSKYNSYVVVLVSVVNRFLIVSIINDPEKTDEGIMGIPTEYEKVIFEPFYRLTKNVYEQYKTLDFGLGLTLVEKIVQKHGGDVTVENIKDHSDLKREPQVKVDSSISIPLADYK